MKGLLFSAITLLPTLGFAHDRFHLPANPYHQHHQQEYCVPQQHCVPHQYCAPCAPHYFGGSYYTEQHTHWHFDVERRHVQNYHYHYRDTYETRYHHYYQPQCPQQHYPQQPCDEWRSRIDTRGRY